MRILHVAEAFGGGLLEMVVTVAAGTARHGHEVAIAYGRRPETPSSVRAAVPDDVELVELPWGRRTPTAELRAARALRGAWRGWRPDVVHLHSSVAGALGAALIPSRVPTVYTPHSFESALPGTARSRRHAIRSVERWIVRRVTLVGAVSPSEADMSHRLGARRVAVVENGIPELEPDNVLERSLPEQHRVMAAGRTVPQRRPEACARMLARMRDVADVCWVGGGGGDRGVSGREALDAASIPATGWLPREEVLRRLGETTVYLHWTAWDGQPLSVLEALARDAVVIASDIEPNRHVLGPGQVFATEDEAVAAMRRVLLDPPHAETLRQEQRARRGRWSASSMVAGWLDVYHSLATDPSGRTGVPEPPSALPLPRHGGGPAGHPSDSSGGLDRAHGA